MKSFVLRFYGQIGPMCSQCTSHENRTRESRAQILRVSGADPAPLVAWDSSSLGPAPSARQGRRCFGAAAAPGGNCAAGPEASRRRGLRQPLRVNATAGGRAAGSGAFARETSLCAHTQHRARQRAPQRHPRPGRPLRRGGAPRKTPRRSRRRPAPAQPGAEAPAAPRGWTPKPGSQARASRVKPASEHRERSHTSGRGPRGPADSASHKEAAPSSSDMAPLRRADGAASQKALRALDSPLIGPNWLAPLTPRPVRDQGRPTGRG